MRAAAPEAEMIVNGVRLGVDPTPAAARRQDPDRRARDPRRRRRRAGNTQLFDSGAFADLAPARRLAATTPAGATGGRLVCLTDGREYTMSASGLGLRP